MALQGVDMALLRIDAAVMRIDAAVMRIDAAVTRTAAQVTQHRYASAAGQTYSASVRVTAASITSFSPDPHQSRGPRVVKEVLNLAGHKIKVLSNTISAVMHDFEEDGFDKCNPKKGKKIVRTPLTSVGPHEEWSIDGHDKLNIAGFGVYGKRDKWGTKFLHYRVLPSNRYAVVVGVALTWFTRPIVAPIRPRDRPAHPFVVPSSLLRNYFVIAECVPEVRSKGVECFGRCTNTEIVDMSGRHSGQAMGMIAPRISK
ncbi:hypothetical protein K438DRAFT_1935171 [Mycena galopus ATCC 62051]|nr:hypothetical protein K438DRAFT_1935171 [Mycena galopus ATCC 62051]